MVAVKNILFLSLFGAAELASAGPASFGKNYERVVNHLGYVTSRFKRNMEPGSDDYMRRFGRELHTSPANILLRRQEENSDNFETEPYAGDIKMMYGCDMDIANSVMAKLHEYCDDTRCNEGKGKVEIDTEYPDNGQSISGKVKFEAEGSYPSGMKHAFIEALQAMVMKEAVEIEEVETSRPALGHRPASGFMCNVVTSSNFFSVVVRDADDQGQVGNMDILLEFESNGGGMCGITGAAARSIIGAINGIAGGIFGFVKELACAPAE